MSRWLHCFVACLSVTSVVDENGNLCLFAGARFVAVR